eukprot:222886-Chlamydomonas_euryale.AAC.3
MPWHLRKQRCNDDDPGRCRCRDHRRSKPCRLVCARWRIDKVRPPNKRQSLTDQFARPLSQRKQRAQKVRSGADFIAAQERHAPMRAHNWQACQTAEDAWPQPGSTIHKHTLFLMTCNLASKTWAGNLCGILESKCIDHGKAKIIYGTQHLEARLLGPRRGKDSVRYTSSRSAHRSVKHSVLSLALRFTCMESQCAPRAAACRQCFNTRM